MPTGVWKRPFRTINIEDFVEMIPECGCWIWKGYVSTGGYGSIRINGHTKVAHRLSWEIYNGIIPNNLQVCHTCDTPPCVNPKHLFLGTAKDNVKDCINKNRHKVSKGEFHKLSKLKDKDIPLILKDNRTLREIAKDYGVTHRVILLVKKRETWKHIIVEE